jgi:hypothetical protein
MIHIIDNDPRKLPAIDGAAFLVLAEKLACNHAATHGEFTAAVIRRLVEMVGAK